MAVLSETLIVNTDMSADIVIDIKAIEDEIGIRFDDRLLLQAALTHRSYLNENPDTPLRDNERLEFLGDAVLDFLVGAYLFKRFPDAREGDLTFMRATFVRTSTLADFTRQVHLAPHILLGRGEELSGARDRDALLADVFEAILGAIYLDKRLASARGWLIDTFLAPAVDRFVEGEAYRKDAKSRFQERAQGQFGITPTYEVVEATGPDHAKVFTMQVLLDGDVWGTGTGRSKQAATQAAARSALSRLEKARGPGRLE